MKKIWTGRSPLLLIVLFFFIHCQTQNVPKCSETSVRDSLELAISLIEKLPDPLREISGMANLGQGQIWSINDEEGKIYVHDTAGNATLSSFSFGPDADYEAIGILQDTVHVLRSDAVICSFLRNDPSKSQCRPITGLPLMCETESLAVRDAQLFTICKGALSTARFQVYRLDFNGDHWGAEPYMDWSPCLNKFKNNASGRVQDLHPSDLYFDPHANHWVMLSTKPSYVLILSDNGEVICSKRLDPDDWPQPEAVCGSDRVGEYWISTEGDKRGKLGKVIVRSM